jgi:hypothetical protein
MPEYCVLATQSAVHVFRGVVALLDHVPGSAGSSAVDVEYVTASDKKQSGDSKDDKPTTMVTDFGLAGQSLSRKFRKAVFWQAKMSEYDKYRPGEMEFAKGLKEVRHL